jgi:polysaccharide export outer membrane protein
MAGASFVGPDGTIQIGPYGCVSVAGLTTAEAKIRLEQHLARYLAHPKVALIVAPAPEVEDAMWRPTRTAGAGTTGNVPSSMWRPARRVAAQKPDEVLPASAFTFEEVKLSQGSPAPPASRAPKADAAEEPVLTPPKAIPEAPLHPVAVVHHQDPHSIAGVPLAPDVPREMSKQPMPRYVIEPPDILLVESTVSLPADQPIRGQHLVRPDGTMGLGIYGEVYVAGMTLEQAREAVFNHLKYGTQSPGAKELADPKGRLPKLEIKNIYVDVLAYNSKWYYVITDGAGYGEQVVRLPVTGNETVLDAVSQIYGLGPVSDKKRIWVARRNPGHLGTEQVLPVDWIGITQHGSVATNYQLMPGDRLYVKADRWRTFDNRLQKILAPIERALGVTLLGSEMVASVRGVNTGGGGTVP